jgi:hypothetical protein
MKPPARFPAFFPALLRVLASIGVSLWLALVGLWLIGRLATDRWHATQYLYWIPTLVVLAVGAPILVVAFLTHWRKPSDPGHTRESGKEATRRAASRRLSVGLGGFSLIFLYGALIEWKIWRGDSTARETGTVRVVFWNESAPLRDRDAPDWKDSLLRAAPDVVIMKPSTGRVFGEVVDRMGQGNEASGLAAPYADFLYTNGFAVISKFDIKRYSTLSLNIDQGVGINPRVSGFRSTYRDYGNAMLLELDTKRTLGRNTILWLIDLPSDVSLSRARVLARAAEVLASPTSQTFEKEGPWGRWQPVPTTKGGPNVTPQIFKNPDLVIGDFNTPRGSWSISQLQAAAGPLVHGYDLAGGGYDASYHRAVPLWHIDHVLAPTRTRIVLYDVRDPDGGTHRMQVIDYRLD